MVNTVLNVLEGLNRANQQVATSELRLASGKRINSVRDDQSGYGIARRAETSSRVNTMASSNISDTRGFLDATISALTDMENDMIREQELLAELNTTGVLSVDEQTAIEIEMETIAEKWADEALTGYTYNGQNLFDQSVDFASLFVNEGSTVAGTAGPILFTDAAGTTNTLSDWRTLWDDSGIAAGTIDLTDPGGSAGGFAGAGLDQGAVESQLTKIRGELARLARLEDQFDEYKNGNTAAADGSEDMRARREDTDIASETVNQTKRNILKQIATAQVANANQSARQVLGLF